MSEFTCPLYIPPSSALPQERVIELWSSVSQDTTTFLTQGSGNKCLLWCGYLKNKLTFIVSNSAFSDNPLIKGEMLFISFDGQNFRPVSNMGYVGEDDHKAVMTKILKRGETLIAFDSRCGIHHSIDGDNWVCVSRALQVKYEGDGSKKAAFVECYVDEDGILRMIAKINGASTAYKGIGYVTTYSLDDGATWSEDILQPANVQSNGLQAGVFPSKTLGGGYYTGSASSSVLMVTTDKEVWGVSPSTFCGNVTPTSYLHRPIGWSEHLKKALFKVADYGGLYSSPNFIQRQQRMEFASVIYNVDVRWDNHFQAFVISGQGSTYGPILLLSFDGETAVKIPGAPRLNVWFYIEEIDKIYGNSNLKMFSSKG